VGLELPQHITPRYTIEEVEALAAPLRARIAELEQRGRDDPTASSRDRAPY
jgi:hypothetical protein